MRLFPERATGRLEKNYGFRRKQSAASIKHWLEIIIEAISSAARRNERKRFTVMTKNPEYQGRVAHPAEQNTELYIFHNDVRQDTQIFHSLAMVSKLAYPHRYAIAQRCGRVNRYSLMVE